MSRVDQKIVVDEEVMKGVLITSKKQETLISECRSILDDLQSDFEDGD